MIDNNDIELWSNFAQGVGAILSLLVSLYIAIIVHRYTSQRDIAEAVRARWEETQNINLQRLSDEDSMRMYEEIVYGKGHKWDAEHSRKMFHLFLMLNQIYHYFFMLENKMITRKQFEKYVVPPARLICRETHLIEYILQNRGYTKDFADALLPILKKVMPIEAYIPPAPPVKPANKLPIASPATKAGKTEAASSKVVEPA